MKLSKEEIRKEIGYLRFRHRETAASCPICQLSLANTFTVIIEAQNGILHEAHKTCV